MKPSIGSTNVKLVAIVGVTALGLVVSAGHIAAAPSSPPSIPAAIPQALSETVLAPDADAALVARDTRTSAALGFPAGAQRIGRHVVDGFQNSEYDEVTELDSAGQVTSVTQFNSQGRLLSAVRLDIVAASGDRVDQSAAAEVAQSSASAVGLVVGAPSSSEADQATGGWTFHWARTQAGVRVRGDETRVQVWPDGRIQSVARVEHDLAAAPTTPLSAQLARQLASMNLNRWFAGKNSSYAIQGLDLEWAGPNAAFDPAMVDAAPTPYRLAWVVVVEPSGDAASAVSLMCLFVDAGDGTIIGGDFVE
jgi:hypothetical protein